MVEKDTVVCVVAVGVAYEQDIRRALAVLKQVGDESAAEQEEIVLEPPEAQGVMSFGASDVAVRLVIKVKAAEHWALERELRRQLMGAYFFEDMVSKNAALLRIFEILPDVAQSNSTVLIKGESGTGKELIAQALHDLSPRRRGPFVVRLEAHE